MNPAPMIPCSHVTPVSFARSARSFIGFSAIGVRAGILLLIFAFTAFATDKMTFARIGPCPRCGWFGSNVTAKVIIGGGSAGSQGTETYRHAEVKCPKHGKFTVSLPPLRFEPQQAIEVPTIPMPTAKVESPKAKSGRKSKQLTTPLPPIVWTK